MKIQTERLIITELTMEMARSLHEQSLDEETRRFVTDEVFETEAVAADVISFLMDCRDKGEGPQVWAVTLKDGSLIGYVQAIPLCQGWEIGYHIGSLYRGNAYATEAVKAFLPVVMEHLGIKQIDGICLAENIGSVKVLERCGFVKRFDGMGLYQGRERHLCRFVYNL